MTSGEGFADGLTRRAALRGAAVAGAAALVDPAGALGRAPGAPGSPDVFSRAVGTLAAGRESAPIVAPRVFSLAGVEWSGSEAARIELRSRSTGGGWSRWALASVLGHGPDRPPAGEQRFGEPVWTGPADQVQLRSATSLSGVRLHFVAVAPVAGGAAHVAQAVPLAQPILDTGPGQPPIIARSAWARDRAHPVHLPVFATVKLGFIHHSDGTNGYSAAEVPGILLGIFAYHVYVRGFWDIAYNFAIDAFGRIWEARAGGIDQPVMGAHAGGYNAESTGMVVLGNFMDVVPAAAAIAASERLLAWKLSLHGVPTLGRVTVEVEPSGAIYTPFAPGAHVSLPRVAGHRDGCTTSCPGNAFYAQIPSMRPRIAGLAGTPARLRIYTAPTAPVSAGTTVTIGGLLTDLSGAGLAGEPIELQSVGVHGVATTIATTMADGNGAWSFTLTPAQNAMLRALHPPSPAAVSDVVALSVAPVLTVSLASASPVAVTGTVLPAGPPVIVDLYRVVGPRRHLLASRRASGTSGAFAVGFGPRKPGSYVVVARTAATPRFVAGASQGLPVTVA
jgi:N-acetylmuramoyl-L-alanine amidase